ncbi:MAG: ankyrin repeat domain-containing protein [Acidobacteriia bacterium]|nr:ankyrin repeat domain-containing protein [Terriglobia bacterium]
MFNRTVMRCALLTMGLGLGIGMAAPSGKELLSALREGDASGAQRLIKSGVPVNAADDVDTSAQMYAAVYADLSTMRLLLDRGADVNHADQSGATALMWSIPDVEKARLLIARGAKVDAVSTLTGRTALLIAAGRPGAARIVQLLLDKGADPKARDREGLTAVIRAAHNGDAETVKLLIARGADVNARGRGTTALLDAINRNDSALVDLLLVSGADAKAQDDDGAGVPASATSYADVMMFRKLIAKGADPKLRGSTGVDLMMAAAASDTTSPELIRELVKLGVDPGSKASNLHLSHGFGTESESPLDWARRQGDTPVARLLVELTGGKARSAPPGMRPLLGAASPQQAIVKALPLLYGGSREFFKRSGCTSCHHNMLPAVAFSLARSKGIALDTEKVRQNYLQSAAWVNGNREGLFQDVRFPGGDTTAAYLMWGLKADGHRRDRATDALAHQLAGSQSLDGGWQVRADRPPIESGRVTPTAISIRALRAYAIPGRKAEFDMRIRRAAKWLAGYPPRTGEEKAMRLLGLVWAGAEAPLIQAAALKLVSDQRPDGGWAQLETLPSDSYATGQTLYALHKAGHLSRNSLDKAVRFLIETQLADGSWHVRSRAYPIQSKYFDTGFPHGRDQWISAAGTSWACIGLSLAVEP